MEEKNLEELQTKVISTKDENGEEHSFELLDVIEVDGKEYGLLVHLGEEEECGCSCEDEECECDEQEVVIMRLTGKGEDYTFEAIDDDEEFNKVVEYIEKECDLEDMLEEAE